MKILGIDPGYERCGFALLNKTNNRLELGKFGVIKTLAQKIFANRLFEITEDFEILIKSHRPDVVSIEDLFFVQNVTTGMKVAQVRGSLIYIAKKHGLPVYEPKPVEVKSVFTGNGKADKTEMQKMTQILFELNNMRLQDDAVDAIAVAFWAANFSPKILEGGGGI